MNADCLRARFQYDERKRRKGYADAGGEMQWVRLALAGGAVLISTHTGMWQAALLYVDVRTFGKDRFWPTAGIGERQLRSGSFRPRVDVCRGIKTLFLSCKKHS